MAKVGGAFGEKVESDEPCRCGLAEHADARFSRMDTLLQGAEVKPVGADHDHLAVQYKLGRRQGAKGRQQLGEVAGHRPAPAAHQGDLVSVPVDERPEAVPFGLVRPAVALRDSCLRDGGQHRLHIERKRQFQGGFPQVSICCG